MKVSELDINGYLCAFERELALLLADGESIIDEGMRYATLGGGKRVRPLCVFLGARAIDGNADLSAVLRLALGIELIHSYSLVHDDLPAMDNDDYRRGRLSVHKKFGHANGILIGDQLLSEAMRVLLEGSRMYGESFAGAAGELAIGAKEMVIGQMYDLSGCAYEDEYVRMYSQKTAALIRSAFKAGAIIAGATAAQGQKIGELGEAVGIAFQLADDLLDMDKNSIIKAIGCDRTRQMLEEKTNSACAIAQAFANANELVDFANLLCNRKK